MSQRGRRYQNGAKTFVDLSARVDPKTGEVRDAEYKAAVVEKDPIDLDWFPHPRDWTQQMVWCPKCFTCFTRESINQWEREDRNSQFEFTCPNCRETIVKMCAYGTPLIPKEEIDRQKREIDKYIHFMNQAYREISVYERDQMNRHWYTKLTNEQANGKQAMRSAYKAGTSGSSYFELRNIRWQGYWEQNVGHADEQRKTLQDYYERGLHQRERFIMMQRSGEITEKEKLELLRMLDPTLMKLEEDSKKAEKEYKFRVKKVCGDILAEGFP